MDGKHTIFGKVVENLALLDTLEEMETSNEKPVKEIKIETIVVLKNPFRDVIAELLLKEWDEKHK